MANAYNVAIISLLVLIIGGAVFLGIMRTNEKVMLTGEVILTEDVLPLVSEQVLLDANQSLGEDTNCVREFEVYESAQITINITSDKPVNYFLLSEEEVQDCLNGKSFESYANFTNSLFVQEPYNLPAGKYAVVITTLDEPANINLVIKEIA
jgi:hypothetical protein